MVVQGKFSVFSGRFSPATRETGVRFPANATFVFYMNAIFYMIVQGKLLTLQALVVQW